MGSDLLADQLSYNRFAVQTNTDGLTQEDSLASPVAGGNCINWVLGHVVATRNGMLKLVGREPIWDKERTELYERGSEPVQAGTALPLGDILSAFTASQETLVDTVRTLSDDDLSAKSPISFFKGDEETVGSALAAFLFHEAYHIGQTGVLRRVAGKDGAIK